MGGEDKGPQQFVKTLVHYAFSLLSSCFPCIFFVTHSSMTYLGIDAFLPSDVPVVQDSGGGLIAVHRCNFGRGIVWCCAFLSVRRAATRSRPQQEYVLIGGLIHDKANPVFRACIPVGIFGVCTIAAFAHFGVYDRLVVFLVLQSAWCVRQQQCFGIVANYVVSVVSPIVLLFVYYWLVFLGCARSVDELSRFYFKCSVFRAHCIVPSQRFGKETRNKCDTR